MEYDLFFSSQEYVENSRKALEADEKRAEARALKEQQAKT